MPSFIRSPKDFCAALIYLVIGVATIVIGQDYPMGTAFKMGPAYFPTLLAGLLTFIGVVSLIRSFVKDGDSVPRLAWKPLLLITAATVVFALLVKGAGLLIALPLFVVMTSFASLKFRWGPSLLLAAGTTVFCTLVFVKGLGVPLPIIGRWFASWIS